MIKICKIVRLIIKIKKYYEVDGLGPKVEFNTKLVFKRNTQILRDISNIWTAKMTKPRHKFPRYAVRYVK